MIILGRVILPSRSKFSPETGLSYLDFEVTSVGGSDIRMVGMVVFKLASLYDSLGWFV